MNIAELMKKSFDEVAKRGVLPVDYDRDFIPFSHWVVKQGLGVTEYLSLNDGGRKELVRDWATPIYGGAKW